MSNSKELAAAGDRTGTDELSGPSQDTMQGPIDPRIELRWLLRGHSFFWPLHYRQTHDELTAATLPGTRRNDIAAMRLDHISNDCESDTETAAVESQRVILLDEQLEDVRQGFRRNADARIRNTNQNRVVMRL
jgi:hypothetical protein